MYVLRILFFSIILAGIAKKIRMIEISHPGTDVVVPSGEKHLNFKSVRFQFLFLIFKNKRNKDLKYFTQIYSLKFFLYIKVLGFFSV